VTKPLDSARVNQDAFLAIIDGMVFGDDPGRAISPYHLHPPALAFALVSHPTGQPNTDQAVAISPKRTPSWLTGAGNDSPADALQKFMANEKVQTGTPRNITINGSPATQTQFSAQTDQGQLRGLVTFISYSGVTYRFLGYANANNYAEHEQAFLKSMNSFRGVSDPKVLHVEPARVSVEKVDRAMTLAGITNSIPPASQSSRWLSSTEFRPIPSSRLG
jgi:predicted Zn-dependent protease